ncbi:monothiol glutaredoxin-S15, mitochondrial isoform X2 [Spinacia oleracea]|uniref:Monothiol glutaredoxin-S15, mitochondrial isoform X2 n=1 Tax=Spinacia oleracea TaxID=3562 RepID=A0ABM3RC60_SPIOL|nr:monothiol glutaredoxin-S15, mitochondrial-like isoform X2 [Spinacia oleracea]
MARWIGRHRSPIGYIFDNEKYVYISTLLRGGGFAKFHIIQVSGLSYQNAMKYSTTPSNDPDTHEYFRSTSKAKSDLSVKDIVEQDVKNNPVMMYIKWIPEMHICGFSALAVRVLKEYLTFERLKKHQKGRLVHGHRQ